MKFLSMKLEDQTKQMEQNNNSQHSASFLGHTTRSQSPIKQILNYKLDTNFTALAAAGENNEQVNTTL